MAPFVGSFLSFVFLKENLSRMYLVALIVMIAGSALAVADTLVRHHAHPHQHTFTHTHDHDHYMVPDRHGHHHSPEEFARLPGALHS